MNSGLPLDKYAVQEHSIDLCKISNENFWLHENQAQGIGICETDFECEHPTWRSRSDPLIRGCLGKFYPFSRGLVRVDRLDALEEGKSLNCFAARVRGADLARHSRNGLLIRGYLGKATFFQGTYLHSTLHR